MVDSIDDYKKFLDLNKNDDLFIHIILTDDKEHPITSSPSVIFFQNFKTEELYHICIDHQDVPKIVDLISLIKDIKEFKGRLFVLDKKSFIQHIPVKSVLDINLGLHLKSDKFINFIEYETPAHKFIKQKFYTYPSLNKVVPLVKHREMVSNIFLQIKNVINYSIFREKYYFKINSLIIETLSELESNGIYVNKNLFEKYFGIPVPSNGYVYSQYNLETSTGRPSNRFGGVNYSALKKDDGSRNSFISRFGSNGRLVMIDYSAFHPRIICELTNFKLSKDVDFYKYIAKLCFKKDDIDQKDMEDIKSLTFRQLYGGVEDKYSHIQYFYNLKSFIENYWNDFNDVGYITTPYFNRKITKHQVKDANPNKLFNYILQATETEIAVPILNKVNIFLKDKKSKSILYTYDSVLFDVHNDEFELIKTEVVEIMVNDKFPIKLYVGESYNSLNKIVL